VYGVPADDIYAANRIKPGESLHIGQKLIIPNAKTMRHVIPLYPATNEIHHRHHTATDIGSALLVTDRTMTAILARTRISLSHRQRNLGKAMDRSKSPRAGSNSRRGLTAKPAA